MARVFCDLRSQKTPRGILPVNSNFPVLHPTTILSAHFIFFLPAGCTSLGERISVWAAAEEGDNYLAAESALLRQGQSV